MGGFWRPGRPVVVWRQVRIGAPFEMAEMVVLFDAMGRDKKSQRLLLHYCGLHVRCIEQGRNCGKTMKVSASSSFVHCFVMKWGAPLSEAEQHDSVWGDRMEVL